MKTFRQGIYLKENKGFSEGERIRRISPPGKVVLPLAQHIGAPCEPLVEKGEMVKKGDKIADSSSFVSSPIHASISGKVISIERMLHPAGSRVTAIVIKREDEHEHEERQIRYEDNEEPYLSSLKAEDIRAGIREAGIVGLGGAAFPTHVKLSPPKDKPIDTIILNGCECEPYLTSDHRTMLERTEDCIYGLKVIIKAAGAESGYVAIERNKPQAIALFRDKLKYENNIKVVALKTKYPQGGEKMLIKAVLNREVPWVTSDGGALRPGLPMDVGVIVNNVGTAVAIAEAIKWGRPLLERVVTVTGSAVKKPSNLLVCLGTPFSHIMDECGGFKEDVGKIIMGGPMMGINQYTLDIPVIKGTSGILVLTKREAAFREEKVCIKCARCIDHCPMSLLPTSLVRLVKGGRWDSLEEQNINECIECGCCAYVCPSKIPLVHFIKLGKIQVKKNISLMN